MKKINFRKEIKIKKAKHVINLRDFNKPKHILTKFECQTALKI